MKINSLLKHKVWLIITLLIVYIFLLTITVFSNNLVLLVIVAVILPSLIIISWLIRLVISRIRNKPGSKLNLKFTIFLIIIALVPSSILFINANSIISDVTNELLNKIKPFQLTLEDQENLTRKLIDNVDVKGIMIDIYNEFFKDKDFYSFNTNQYNNISKNIKKRIDFFIIFDYVNEQVYKKFDLIKDEYYILTRFVMNADILQKIMKDLLENKIDLLEAERTVPLGKSDNVFNIFMIKGEGNTYFIGGKNIKAEYQLAKNVSEMKNLLGKIQDTLKIEGDIKMRDIETQVWQFQITILSITLPVIFIAIILSFIFLRSITKPIEELLKGTMIIAEGDLTYKIKERGVDEFDQLIRSFNQMAKELNKNQEKLYQAEKSLAWKEVARRLAHEVKNPLTPIKLASERLIRQYNKKHTNFGNVLNSCVNTIITETDRLSTLVNEFSEFARFPEFTAKSENIVKILKEVINLYSPSNPSIEFKINNLLEKEEEDVYLDKKKIKQVLINLIENSLSALENVAGCIEFSLQSVYKKDSSFCKIEIKDTGKGIPKEIRDKIFEPYISDKEEGTGLGLSIIKSIIDEHNGEVYFSSSKTEGTSFIIELPYIFHKKEMG